MQRHLQLATFLATSLDNQFSVLGYRFGLSSFIDLIPGFGDVIDAMLALYIVSIGIQMGLPLYQIIHMLWNVFISFIIGLFPFVGDVAYIFYKPNLRNLKIIQRYAERGVLEGQLV